MALLRTCPLRLTSLATAILLLSATPGVYAMERVTLRTGTDLTCDHHLTEGAKTRLYFDAASDNYLEVASEAITADETIPDPPQAKTGAVVAPQTREVLNPAELHEVLRSAGQAHDLDIDLLASVVHAESASHVHARSKAGAEGLMQLMPATAAALGVHNAYQASENVGGGTAYLDSLLLRYHNNLVWALAAYNAGPGAVDRWHGIPPYRETRLYVARIIHEFNQRYAARQAAAFLARVK